MTKATSKTASTSTTEQASDENGALKSYLGQDAADLQAASDTGDVNAPDKIVVTEFEGVQPPAGHVSDPTSVGHVGSDGTATEAADSK